MKKGFLLIFSILLCLVGLSQSTYTQSFTTSGSWICPAGVTSITVECWGGGGAGGGTTPSVGAGGGGAGGAYAKKVISVTPGSRYYFGVAASKAGGGSSGSQGDPSWFNSSGTNAQPGTLSSGVLAEGGAGGSGSGSSSSASGSKSSSFGDLTYKGGNGGAASAGGNLSSSNSGAGAGGAGSTGDGGSASGTTAGTGTSVGGGNGAAGVAYGSNLNGTSSSNTGGGGSGATRNSGTTKVGGAGGPGSVKISYTECVPLFEQDFNSSTTVSDYVYTAANHTQLDEVVSTISLGTPVAPSINTTTSNKLRFNGTDGSTKSNFVRNTDFATTPTNVVVKFDITFSSVSTGANQSAIFYLGTGFSTGTSGVAPTATAAHSRLQFATSATSSTGFQIRNTTPVNVGPDGTASTFFTGKQTVTWVINNSGGTLSYLAPNGTTENVADDKEDIWVGTTRVVNDDGAWGPTKALTDMAFYYLNGSMIIDVDNITVNPIVSSPTSSSGSSVVCTGFTANWTTSGCNASLEVATDNTFTSIVSGYPLSVTGSSYSVTGLSTGTTYYYRLRTSMGSNSNVINSAYSSTQSITTTAPSVGGTVAADQNVISGGNAADINLSGHTGSVVKWQRDVVSTFATATDIANTTTSVTGTSMGAITQTIYYRAVVQNGTCPSINSAYVTITVVSGLPIELLYFSGVEYGSVNNLYWSTASEDNNDYFNIEKSTDGKVWTVICKLKGAGNSTNKLNYSFVDDNVEKTINYYKLKQTDYDGRFKYSEIISIDNRNISKSKIIDKTTNILGQEVNIEYYRGLVIIYYTDGSSEKIIK